MSESTHFKSSELACKHCGVDGTVQALADGLEKLREIVGVPIVVDDAFRCTVHNAEVGGVPDSAHTQGIAADIKITGMTAVEMYAAVQKVPEFKGIGVAEKQGYIHVDLRETPAKWCYDESGKSCKWNLT